MMDLRLLLKNAFVAAIYVVLTVVLTPYMSYQAIQFRVAEVLLILFLFNSKYALGILVGTFISNLFSPFGVIDWVVGTGASAISLYGMGLFKKKPFIALLMPTIVNGIIIGIQLNLIFKAPLLASMGFVAFGEFVVVSMIGYFIYKLLENNEGFKHMINH